MGQLKKQYCYQLTTKQLIAKQLIKHSDFSLKEVPATGGIL